MAISGENAVLYAFWASSCSWRVRATLTAKRISFEERPIDIVKEKQHKTESYRAICQSQKVPALQIEHCDCLHSPLVRGAGHGAGCRGAGQLYQYDDDDGVTLVESMAIIQYIEDTRPPPSLAPPTPLLRARMREIVETVVAGIQPLQNVGLRASFDNERQYTKFIRHSTSRGLETLEELLSRIARNPMFCVGDQLTYADVCLVPQVYNAIVRHKIDIRTYPAVAKLYESLLKDDVFTTTHPEKVKGGS